MELQSWSAFPGKGAGCKQVPQPGKSTVGAKDWLEITEDGNWEHGFKQEENILRRQTVLPLKRQTGRVLPFGRHRPAPQKLLGWKDQQGSPGLPIPPTAFFLVPVLIPSHRAWPRVWVCMRNEPSLSRAGKATSQKEIHNAWETIWVPFMPLAKL